MAADDLARTYAAQDGLGLAALVATGEVAPREFVETAIAAIERLNPHLNAVVHELYDIGRAAAAAGPRQAPFAGVPYLVKESGTELQGAPLTSASRWMRHVRASADGEIVRRIKAAGFVIVGKSNAPENGWSITTEPRLYGATRNPWRDGISPGGSSGGSAAAVAARMVPVAEASDGAGSIRVPASCCGVVGLKPSRGRVTPSPAGDAWYGCAYDLCVSRTVRDTAAYLDALAGMLPGDAYYAPQPSAALAVPGGAAARPPPRRVQPAAARRRRGPSRGRGCRARHARRARAARPRRRGARSVARARRPMDHLHQDDGGSYGARLRGARAAGRRPRDGARRRARHLGRDLSGDAPSAGCSIAPTSTPSGSPAARFQPIFAASTYS